MIEYTISKNDSNIRIDKFLFKATTAPSSLIYKTFRKKDVKVNGKWVREDYLLSENDVVRIFISEEFKAKKKYSLCPLEAKIEYEDENIIVFNKGANLPCQPDAKHKNGTLSDMLKSYLYEKGEYDFENENSFSPALCNRIDTNTTGLVIGAKNAAALREMNFLIKTRQVSKYYKCRVEGKVLKDHDDIKAFIVKDEKTNISKIESDGKPVSMKYWVTGFFEKETELEILLNTGRSHQIRAYFASIGHPLVGDKKYGAQKGGGQILCSYRLVFDFNDDYRGILSYLNGKEIKI
ncbi:MAG: RluA family pseudouridine synthase [Clostridia bacterium]|nr:RluA family pseudouridine synthase [Clostridia bacterium]